MLTNDFLFSCIITFSTDSISKSFSAVVFPLLAPEFEEITNKARSLDDMAINMPYMLKVLDATIQTHEVVLLERNRRYLQLESPTHLTVDTAVQLRIDGDTLLGEVTASIPRNGHFVLAVRAREVLPGSWHPHPDWSALDTEESVCGSLAALNSHLVFYEKQRTRNEAE
ncbi:MAG: hypothetical protein ABI759_01700 [Candidatus Solibacter sp.]